MLQSFVVPYHCSYCRCSLSSDEPLCPTCTILINPTLSSRLQITGDEYLQVYAVSAYEEPLKTLILAKQYNGYEASQHLGTLIWCHSVMPSMRADFLIPVPLHSQRAALRGYNQARVIAEQLSRYSGIPILDCIVRTRNTRQQSQCRMFERYDNVKGAFKMINGEALAGKNCILVDDMMTTGATLQEVARTVIPFKPACLRSIVACSSF